MNRIEESFRIASPPDDVWPLLSDPFLVASCVPGATLLEAGPDGAHRGSIAVKFGPTTAVFNGQVVLKYDDDERICRIEGRGKDQRGASNASASGVVRVSGDETTEVRVDGSFQVTGPLAVFARTGGVHIARVLIGEFSRNLEKRLHKSPAVAAATPSETVVTPAPGEAGPVALSGFGLLRRAVVGWLKAIFVRR